MPTEQNARLKTRAQIFTMLLVMAMFAVVDICGATKKEIIFPEISALALGFWIMRPPLWQVSKFAVWASPTLGALTGIIFLRYVPLSRFFLIAGAFILVAILLRLLKSDVFPSISAAILPIITNSTSWLYPLSVAILMAVILLGNIYLDTDRQTKNSDKSHCDLKALKRNQRTYCEFVYWGKILAGVLLVSALAVRFNCLFMIAPPLIVAYIQLSRLDHAFRQTPLKALLLLVLAAYAGVIWFYTVRTILDGPLWLFAGLSLFTVFLLSRAMQETFPPAAAITLLPALVPASALWIYPLHVLAGSVIFIVMAIFLFKE